MQAKKDITYSRAFVLDAPALQKLDEIVIKDSGAVSYEVRLSDGTVLEPANLDDVLSLPNPETRQIRRITVSGPYRAPLHINLSVQDDSFDDTVNVSIRGEEKEVVFVSRELDDWVASISKDYGFISITSTKTILVQMSMVAAGFLLFGIPSDRHWGAKSQVVATIMGAVLIFMAFCRTLFRRWVFPIAIFAIGDGVRRRKIYESRQNRFTLWAIGGVIVAFALSVLANKLSK